MFSMVDLTVYFKKPIDWANVLYIHFWDTRPHAPIIDWPGVLMTEQKNHWFAYRFMGVTSTRLLFHDGHGRQTSDLQRDHPGWYTLDGGWFDQNPDDAPSAVEAEA
ncbi:MAG TPA: hypothetical protein DCS31_08100 [Candidatus Competibacteraceae bacterium]|nr:hypothetical protein [Candidatus Competibacteraceae bacterium]